MGDTEQNTGPLTKIARLEAKVEAQEKRIDRFDSDLTALQSHLSSVDARHTESSKDREAIKVEMRSITGALQHSLNNVKQTADATRADLGRLEVDRQRKLYEFDQLKSQAEAHLQSEVKHDEQMRTMQQSLIDIQKVFAEAKTRRTWWENTIAEKFLYFLFGAVSFVIGEWLTHLFGLR